MLHFNTLEEVLNQFSEQKIEIINTLTRYFAQLSSDDPISNELNSKRQKQMISCPRCGDKEHIVGYGYANGKHRYMCKTCGRKFVETVNTAIYWLHKRNLFQQYLECMLESKSIRKSAAFVGIAQKTSFEWRHRVLSALPEILNMTFSNIVEVGVFQLDYSEKGTPIPIENEENMNIPTTIFAASDKEENLVMQVVGRGDNVVNEVKTFAEKKINHEVTICIENGQVAKIFKKMGYEIYRVQSKKVKLLRDNPLHNNNIQKTIFDFVTWLSNFQQVATKYLQNYLNWFVFLNKISNIVESEKIFLKKSLVSNEAWRRRRYLKKHLLLVE